MKPLKLVVACALLDQDLAILLSQRPVGQTFAGMWEFPGGKLEKFETCEQALIRELKEELNIFVTIDCLAPFTFASHEYDDFHLLMPLYICRKWSGELKAMEGQNIKWVAINQLKNYQLLPADKPLVAMLQDLLL